MKYLSNLYTKCVTPSEKGAYPIVDRIISYGLPTAGAVLWSVFGTHKGDYTPFNKTGAHYGLPAGLAFYALSQVGLTYAKPLVEVKEEDSSFDKGWKKVAAGGIEVVDILNNVVPYTIAFNMLPKTYATNTVFAFNVMPAIIKGVESDITAAVNGRTYTKTFADEVYSSLIAGIASKNLSSHCTSLHKTGDTQDTETFNSVFIGSIVGGFTFPILKKILIGKNYKPGEFKNDFYRSALQNIMYETDFFMDKKLLPENLTVLTEQSVFENIAFFTAVEVATLALDKTCESIESHPELYEDSTSVANIQTESA